MDVDPFPVLTTALDALRQIAEDTIGGPTLEEAVYQFVAAIDETLGGRDLLAQRASFIENSTSEGTSYFDAHRAAMRCLENVEPHTPIPVAGHEIEDRLVDLMKRELPHEYEYELSSTISDLEYIIREHRLDTPEFQDIEEFRMQAKRLLSRANNYYAEECNDIRKIADSGFAGAWALRIGEEVDNAGKLYQAAKQLVGILRLGNTSSTTTAKLADTTRERANTEKLFPTGLPKNLDIVDLAIRLNTESGNGKSDNQIAVEFTEGNTPKAQSLLSQIRRMKRQGRINL